MGRCSSASGSDLLETRHLAVCPVTAGVADKNGVLPDRGQVHKLVGHAPAHDADVRANGHGGQSAPGEDPEVRFMERPVLLVQTLFVSIQAIGVLHGELAGPDQASPGTRVVAELGLDLVDEPGQPLVRVNLTRRKPGDDLLVGHRQHHLPIPAVAQPDQLPPRRSVPARPLPHVGGLHHGHRNLLPANRVHLFPQNAFDLPDRPPGQRQIREHPRRQLPDEPGPEQQSMSFDLHS